MAYSNIKDSSAHFQIATWTGDGSTSDRNIINDGNSDLAPDLIWGACRSAVQHKHLTDSSRGFSTGNKELISSGNNVEGDTNAVNTGAYGWLGPSLTNGFESSYGSVNNGYWNVNARTYVAWQWKANGGTTSSNTDGDITSTVQANQDAGFSIVTFTTDGTTKTVGHGLGVKPDIVLVKSRNVVGSWLFITDIVDGSMDYGVLNSTAAFSSIGYDAPTTSVFSYNDNNTNTQVAYCFAEKQGYSRFGKYIGTGARSYAPFIYTGFKPAFVMVRCSNLTGQWLMFDSARNPYNGDFDYILANTTGVEENSGLSFVDPIDFLSNGFRVINYDAWMNGGNNTYIYMAFAENPFVAGGVPTTAR